MAKARLPLTFRNSTVVRLHSKAIRGKGSGPAPHLALNATYLNAAPKRSWRRRTITLLDDGEVFGG